MNLIIKNKNFRALYLSGVINTIGTTLFNIVFIVYASSMSHPKLAISIVSFINFLPYILNVYAGYLADKTSRKIRSILNVRVIQVILYVLASLVIKNNDWLVFGFVVLVNFVSDLLGTYGSYLTLPLLKHIVPEKELAHARGLQSGSSESINMVGGMVGASILALVHNDFMLFSLINALTFLVSFLVLKGKSKEFKDILEDNQATKEVKRPESIKDDIVKSFKALKKYDVIFHFTLIYGVINFLGDGMGLLIELSLLSDKTLRFGTYGFSVAFVTGLESLGIVIGSFYVVKFLQNLSLEVLTLLEITVMVVYIINACLIQNNYILLLMSFLNGYFIGITNPKTDAYIIGKIPEENLGVVMSSFYSLITITLPIGIAIFSILGSVSTYWAWIVLLIATLLCVVYGYFLQRKYETNI